CSRILLTLKERKRYTQASSVCLGASHQAERRVAVRDSLCGSTLLFGVLVAAPVVFPQSGLAQQPDGPQTSAPPPVAPPAQAAPARQASTEKIRIPAGTRVAVVLENGISTRSAKAGDS